MSESKFTVNYDNENDVLYILTPNMEYYDKTEGNYTEVRNKNNDKLLGYVITDYSNCKDTLQEMPWRECSYKRDILPLLRKDKNL